MRGVANVHFELIEAETHAAPLVANDASEGDKEEAAVEVLGEKPAAFHRFVLDHKTFVGGDHVSIADIRLACSLEFLKVIDYHFPAWAKTYTDAVAKALGDAYAEPGKDVEGYIAYVKGQKG